MHATKDFTNNDFSLVVRPLLRLHFIGSNCGDRVQKETKFCGSICGLAAQSSNMDDFLEHLVFVYSITAPITITKVKKVKERMTSIGLRFIHFRWVLLY